MEYHSKLVIYLKNINGKLIINIKSLFENDRSIKTFSFHFFGYQFLIIK